MNSDGRKESMEMEQQQPFQYQFAPPVQLYKKNENQSYYLSSPQELQGKVDVFVTLGGFESDEGDLLQNIHINNSRDINDFHLEKIFDEQSQHQHLNNGLQQMSSLAQQQQDPKPPKQYRKGSSQLPSFQDLLDKMIENFLENLIPNNFQEYNKFQVGYYLIICFQEAILNIENFIILEQKLSSPYMFKHFLNNYLRFLEKMKSYKKQGRFKSFLKYCFVRLDLRQMIQFICFIGIEFIQELINVLKKCDDSWCFQILKQEQEPLIQPNQSSNINLQSTNVQSKQNFKSSGINQPSMNIQQNLTTNFPQNIPPILQANLQTILSTNMPQIQMDIQNQSHSYNSQILQSPSNFNQPDDIEKKSRKAWTKEELQILQSYINQYQTSNIPSSILTQLCQQLGRTQYSVQSKLQKLKKNIVNQDLQQNSRSVNNWQVESQNFTRNDGISSSGATKQKQSNKYEMPLEDIIKQALRSLPNCKGTKQQIMTKINQMFFCDLQDDQWKRSVSMLLSSNKTLFIRKLKGSYGLNNNIPEQMEENGMRYKLYEIISHTPKQRASVGEIFQKYINVENLSNQDEETLRVIKKRINQTLLQSVWFDKSQSKTQYSLIE